MKAPTPYGGNSSRRRLRKAVFLAALPVWFALPPVQAGEAAFSSAPGRCGPPACTLTGKPVRLPDLPENLRRELELDLKVAKAAFDAAPEREDSYIWLGRRLGYLGRYDEAIEVFTEGLAKFPESYKLHRFRGRHRARNRDFDGAIADYEAGLAKMEGIADSFEPDGMPNARGLTLTTYRGNLHYYLGQTLFAKGDYRRMIEELGRSLETPIALPIEDMRVAVVFWQSIAHYKLGEEKKARALLSTIPAELDLIENQFYHRAVKVLQGRVDEETVLREGDQLAKFALGMKAQFDGDKEKAVRILNAIVEESPLGYWPAEAELVGSLAR